MRPPFEFFSHTADIGAVAYGADLAEVFANAACAMFNIITDPAAVRESLSREVTLTAPDHAELLVDWLNELLFLFDAHQLLGKRFAIHELAPDRLRATVWGEHVDPARHHMQTAVKAVTYHLLAVECGEEGCWARIIFDI